MDSYVIAIMSFDLSSFSQDKLQECIEHKEKDEDSDSNSSFSSSSSDSSASDQEEDNAHDQVIDFKIFLFRKKSEPSPGGAIGS